MNSIVSVVTDSLKTAHFFIHDSADIKKTFLYECLCHHFRAQTKIILCMISTSIAAQLLFNERTSHSRFKISIVCHDTLICFITACSELVNLLKCTILIIWNEISMQHKHNFMIINASLCDILQFSDVFNEISAILDENFAQITFVISQENQSAQINVSICSFWIWNHLTVLKLHRNMQIQSSLNNQQFVEWIDCMSYDFDLYDVRSLSFMIINHYETSRSFIDHVYSLHDLAQAHTSSNFFRDRAILCSHNNFVNLLNQQIMNDFFESARLFMLIDMIENNDVKKIENISMKYLQTLELFEFFLSQMYFKIKTSIMLLCNLHLHERMCNNTQLIITYLHQDCIEDCILKNEFDEDIQLISRIKLISKKDDYSWVLSRKQFSIHLCFAMIINKLQEQSLSIVDINLSLFCFSHEQLYVALFKVTDVWRLLILFHFFKNQCTDNVVYSEILLL